MKKRGKKGQAFQKAHVQQELGRFSERQRAFAFRTSLKQALLDARTFRDGKTVEDFFSDLERRTSVDRNRANRQAIGFDHLTQNIYADALPLHEELRWLASRLAFFSREIAIHSASIAEIQQAVFSENWKLALTLLNEHERALGTSLWSVMLNFAILQEFQGPEILRHCMLELKRKNPSGMFPFIANYASQRAEPSVSMGWFHENLKSRIAGIKRDDIRHYLEYKLSSTLPDGEANLAAYLKVEQNHNEVDVFETTIAALQKIAIDSKLRTDSQVLIASREVLNKLSDVSDFRLEKLRVAFGVQFDATLLTPASTASLDLAILAEARDAIKIAHRALRKDPTALYDTLCLGALGARRAESGEDSDDLALRRRISRGLSAAIRRSNKSGAGGGAELRKIAATYSSLPFGSCLLGVFNACNYSNVSAAPDLMVAAGLNSPEVGPIELFGSPTSIKAYSGLLQTESAANRVFATATPSADLPLPSDSVPPEILNVFSAERALREHRSQDAISDTNTLKRSDSALSAIARSIRLHAFADLGEIGEASQLISEGHTVHGCVADSDSIDRTFDGRTWNDLRPFSDSLATSVGLLLFSERTKDDRFVTYRRFALEAFLKSRSVDRPSLLKEQTEESGNPQFRFFLQHVCTPPQLDMLRSIRSSQEVLEERRAICAVLRTIDPLRADVYDEELILITQELTIRVGMQAFDGSRVHVDRAGIRSIARRELAESYQRYRSLLERSPEENDAFAALIRELLGRELSEKHALSLPENEADLILIVMVQRLKDLFLLNAPFGLDSYLSKRVRHGSIVGHIRGPIEIEGLVLQRGSSGQYAPNAKTMSLPSKPGDTGVLKALTDFSRSVDDHLLRIKDVILHVKSDSHPLGVFDAPVNIGNFRVFKAMASVSTDLDSFIDNTLMSLWTLLGPSLGHAQTFLERETKPFLVERFSILRSQMLELASPSERAMVEAAIGRATTGAQAKIDSAKAWFQPQELADRPYSFADAISIGLSAVQAIKSGFSPRISTRIELERDLQAIELPTFVDILFAALGNVADHSGLVRPEVEISVAPSVASACARIQVDSQISQLALSPDLAPELAEIRRRIEDETDIERVRSEGKSGLRKIASIAAKTDGGTFDFSLQPGNRFRVAVDMSLKCLTAAASQ